MSAFSVCKYLVSSQYEHLRILFHQGSCKDKFRKVFSWFSSCQDVSETLLKKWGHRSIFFNG